MSGQQHAPAALYPRERPGTHVTGGYLTYLLYINHFLIQFIYAPRQLLDTVKMCLTGIFNFDCAEMFLHILKLTLLASVYPPHYNLHYYVD